MRHLVKPMDLSTATSFVYWIRLADMLAERAKKQRNIVKAIIVLNPLFIMLAILSWVVGPLAPLAELLVANAV